MKTMEKLFFSAITVLLCGGLLQSVSAVPKDLQKTYTWKYSINKDASVSLDNYDCNTTIHTWDKAEAEYHLTIDAKTRSDEDATVLDTYLASLKFSNSPGSVSFRNTFWENRTTIMGRTTMKLKGDKSVSLTDFTIKGELWIPAGCKLDLTSKYSEINLENLSGPIRLDLYNDHLYGGSVGAKADITDKYSTIEFKDMKDIVADLYSSKLEAKNTGNLKIVSKYSKITAVTVGVLDIDGYSDKYNFTGTGNITFIAKYSDFRAETSGKVSLDCYEGTIVLNKANDILLTSKYADFQLGQADNITISSTYSDKLTATNLKSLIIGESKYCTFRIDELAGSVTEKDGYEDKFNILKTGQDFRELNITGKYIDIVFNLPKSIDYRFRAKIDYPKLDLEESQLKLVRNIMEGSSLEYDGIKGIEREDMPRIEVNGYQMSLKIIGI